MNEIAVILALLLTGFLCLAFGLIFPHFSRRRVKETHHVISTVDGGDRGIYSFTWVIGIPPIPIKESDELFYTANGEGEQTQIVLMMIKRGGSIIWERKENG